MDEKSKERLVKEFFEETGKVGLSPASVGEFVKKIEESLLPSTDELSSYAGTLQTAEPVDLTPVTNAIEELKESTSKVLADLSNEMASLKDALKAAGKTAGKTETPNAPA